MSNDSISEYMIDRRTKSEYDIDGIIVDDAITNHSINTSGNPKHSFAFKMVLTDQIAEVLVSDVEWKVSKHGLLKPRIRYEPVTIGGATLQYATAFLQEEMSRPEDIAQVVSLLLCLSNETTVPEVMMIYVIEIL